MKFNKTVLASGIRLITVPMVDNPSVTVLVMVEAGSKYETKDTRGLSHFLEHMVFKGTTRRPKASDIARELDSIGASYNAFTSQEFTGYYAKSDYRHLDTILDIVSDLYVDPLFDEKELEKEKGVIIEEMRMYQDLPQRHVADVFNSLLHGDQPAGWNIVGTEETVRSFTQKHLIDYRAAHYVSGATTVIVSGSFDEKTIAGQVEKAFATVIPATQKSKVAVIEKQGEPRVATEFKETDQTHIVIGVRTFPVLDPRIPAMHVLSTIMGGGMSSRLFSKLRDEMGICYYVRASHNPNTDHGDLTISAGVDNSRVKEAITSILAECERLVTELVSDAELKKAKDNIAGSTLLELETSDARAEFYAFQEVLKHHLELPDELIAKVQQVTAADVQKLATDIFKNEKLNLAVIGRFKDGSSFRDYFKLGV